jgi:hypothetical protein
MAELSNFLDFEDFLETQPEALYQSFLTDPSSRMPASMKRYYQNQFSNIQNEYIGQLARQMREGQLPTRTFQDYLTKDVFTRPEQADPMSRLGRFTGYDRFRRESPYARTAYGAGPMSRGMFAPSARWITY